MIRKVSNYGRIFSLV